MTGLDARIMTFLTDSTALSVNGPRRMSRSELMDHVEEAVLKIMPDINVVRIDDGCDPAEAEIPETGRVAVFLVDPSLASELKDLVGDRISDSFLVFCTQELCHQVPVCIKGFHGLDICYN